MTARGEVSSGVNEPWQGCESAPYLHRILHGRDSVQTSLADGAARLVDFLLQLIDVAEGQVDSEMLRATARETMRPEPAARSDSGVECRPAALTSAMGSMVLLSGRPAAAGARLCS